MTETLNAAREVTITGHDKRSVQGKVDDSNVGERVIDVTGNFSQDVTGTHSQGSDGAMSLESAVKLSTKVGGSVIEITACLLYTSPSPRDS